MEKSIEEHYLELQRNTKSLLKEVSSLSSTTYHYKPQENKWSISQILTHLLVAEKMSLEYMQKKSLGRENISNAGLIEYIKIALLKISQRLPFRYKAPKRVVDKTPSPLSFGDLVRQWEQLRVELVVFLEDIKKEDVHKKVYKHPVAGRLSVVHALQFFTEHLNHHRPQVLAILKQMQSKKFENPHD